MFRKILDKFHKSNNQKGKLLKFKEFYELDKKLKKYYFAGLFQKNQATSRFISKYQKSKTTEPTPTRMIDFLKQSYNDPLQENIPKDVHDLFVDIAMNEDLESCNSDPVDRNTTQSSTEVQEPVSTHFTDVTTRTPAADTTTITGSSAPCASAATFTITNIHPAAAVTTNNHSILFTINVEDEDKVEIKYLATESIHHPLDLKFSGTIPRRIAKG